MKKSLFQRGEAKVRGAGWVQQTAEQRPVTVRGPRDQSLPSYGHESCSESGGRQMLQA